MKKIFLGGSTIIGMFLAKVSGAFAALPPPPGSPITLSEIEGRIDQIVLFIIAVSTTIALGVIVWSGIKWATSQGDSGRVEEARTSLRNGVIGLAVILGVGVIMATIRAILNRTFFL